MHGRAVTTSLWPNLDVDQKTIFKWIFRKLTGLDHGAKYVRLRKGTDNGLF
jgi:hypothetical protein